MKKKINYIGIGLVVAVWLFLTAFSWFGPKQAESLSERRKLAQAPTLSVETLLAEDDLNPDGSIRKRNSFMSQFEAYSLDQFPMRDTFRKIKSMFYYNALQQIDNHNIYVADGVAAEMIYPLDETMIKLNMSVFDDIYKTYLRRFPSVNVYMSVIPDKNFYLAEKYDYLKMDYDKLFAMTQELAPWATHIDLTGSLTSEDYYQTDTHWRQEAIVPVAQTLATAMGVPVPQESDFTAVPMDVPFYGVYYGQAALPMDPETIYLMQNETINSSAVLNMENNTIGNVYDMAELNSKDPYGVYLSGVKAILKIQNPNPTNNRELIIFRDSFGSSISPLLIESYATITLIDLRYVETPVLTKLFSQMRNQDVLFLFSSLILNKTPLN